MKREQEENNGFLDYLEEDTSLIEENEDEDELPTLKIEEFDYS